jgi:hypothetical protein
VFKPSTFWIATALAAVVLAGSAQAQIDANQLARDLAELNVRVRTPHYAIAGTASEKALREYGGYLEAVYAEYARGFGELLQDLPGRSNRQRMAARRPGPRRGADLDAERFQVIVFAEEEHFEKFSDHYLQGALEHANGCYIPRLSLLLILDLPDREATRGVLFHEAFHQFFHHYVANPPVWLDEGLATYFEIGQLRDGRVIFDQPHEHYWKVCQKLLRGNAATPFAELLAADRLRFYDAGPTEASYGGQVIRRRTANYAQAHTLVYMMQKDSAALQHLRAYIRELATDSGRHTRQITDRYFDAATCQAMQTTWARYVQDWPSKGR